MGCDKIGRQQLTAWLCIHNISITTRERMSSSLQLTPDLQPLSCSSPLQTSDLLHPPPPLLQTLQHKNALFYGRLNPKKQPEGLGIVIYDSGDVLVCRFMGGAVRGHFCYFWAMKGWLYGDWAEGQGKDGLDGWAYLYGRDGRAVRVLFRNGKVVEDCEYEGGKAGRTNVYNEIKQIYNKNHMSSSRTKLPLSASTDRFHQHQLKTPTDFLQSHLSQPFPHSTLNLYPQPQPEPIPEFRLFEIDSNQVYYGTTQNGKPHGVGLILVNQWPVCYGSFVDGQLEGLGRVEQGRGLSWMELGWVLDEKEKVTGLGRLVEEGGRKVFQLSEQFAQVQVDKVVKFRRRQHLQSLSYSNSHLPELLPKLHRQFLPCHFSPFTPSPPTATEQNAIPFPSFISQISRIHNIISPKSRLTPNPDPDPTDSDHEQARMESLKVERDLVELIKEYNQNKDCFQRTERMLEVRIRDRDKLDRTKPGYVKENSVISYNPTISASSRNLSKSKSRSRSIKNMVQSRPTQSGYKNGNIQNINKIGLPSKGKQKPQGHHENISHPQSARREEKRLDLQKMYSKYLKKQL